MAKKSEQDKVTAIIGQAVTDKELAKSLNQSVTDKYMAEGDKVVGTLDDAAPNMASGVTGTVNAATIAGAAGVGAAFSKWALKGKASTGALVAGALAVTFTAVEGAVNFIKGSKKLAGDLDKHTDRVLGEAIREHKEKETDPAKLQQLDAAEKLLHGGKAAPKAQQAVAASQPTPEPAAPADNTPPATSHADKIVAERQAAQGKAASVA